MEFAGESWVCCICQKSTTNGYRDLLFKSLFYANYLPSLNSAPEGKVAVIISHFLIVLFIGGDYSR